MPSTHKKQKPPIRRSKRRRTVSTPKVRKPAKPKTLKQRLRRAVAVLTIILVLSLTTLWITINKRVATRLNSVNNPRLPVIYSAPFNITDFIARLGDYSPRNASMVKSALAERRYSEVSSSPNRPGDFFINDLGLRIFTRGYHDSHGDLIAAKKELIPWRGAGERTDSGSVRGITLEPQVISYIGSADARASSFVSLSDIPPSVQNAVLAIEDERFYKHFGLDLISIGRAAFRNLMALKFVEGGSTLTQQLAKNIFLSPRRSLSRKLMEIPTAISIEHNLTKHGILELYLNEVYLGQEGSVAIHGMPEAASSFFGKRIQDLRLDEAALLAGMIKAPSMLNPRRYEERARERRDTVLKKMLELRYITEGEFKESTSKPIQTAPKQEHRRLAPYFSAALESELSKDIDLETALRSDLAVYTGIDLGLQSCAEKAIERGVVGLESAHPRLIKGGKRHLEAALVAIEPYSGLIRSWVGGRDFSSSQFNRVNQGVRQAGSTIKPFLYLTALDGSLNSYKIATALSIVEDKPMEFKIKGQRTWNPENYDHEYRGDVTLRYALENSLNMAALYIAERVGLPALKRTVNSFELSLQDFSAVPSLALGALDTNLLRLTGAYAALANGGLYIPPRLYNTALDGDGTALSAPPIVERRVADEAATYVLTNILQGALDRGTGKGARSKGFTAPAAGKTGTSNDARDAWFIGFTPELSVGVWVGFDDNSQINLTGGAAAAPIWGDFMNCAAQHNPTSNFIPPPDVVFVGVDSGSGMLASSGCPSSSVVKEVFVRGTEPSKSCREHPPREVQSGEDSVVDGGRGDAERGFWSRWWSS
jgi:penicillin-binding protein 1B